MKMEKVWRRGPKPATLRKLTKKASDFLILTETIVDVCAVKEI
jgi:hypothetical protein